MIFVKMHFRMKIVATLFCLFVFSKFEGSASAENTSEILKKTLPAYTITVESEILSKSSVCRKNLGIFRKAVNERKLWSLKLLDSSGEPKPGFIYGNNYWLGLKTQCSDLGNRNGLEVSPETKKKNSIFRDVKEEFPPFEINYFAAHFQHNSTLQYHGGIGNEDVITLGLCLPAVCNTEELSSILVKIFEERTLIVSGLYGADFRLLDVKDLRDNQGYMMNWHFIALGIILILSVSLLILGTIYDIAVHQNRLMIKKLSGNPGNNDAVSSDAQLSVKISGDTAISVSNDQPGFWGKILLCFSVYTNTKILFNTNRELNSIDALHGIRFITTVWIMAIHFPLFTKDYIDNKTWGWKLFQGVPAQILTNGSYSVDTFFFMSGFLATYSFYRSEMKKKKSGESPKKFTWRMLMDTIYKRFVRLTPSYITTMLIVELVYTRFDRVSQFYMTERNQDTCKKFLWRNILYINTLFRNSEMCAVWSWYLSNDMQFYIIGMILAVYSVTYFYTCCLMWIILLVGSILTTGCVSYFIGYTPTFDVQWATVDNLYFPPWIRIGPYLIGIAGAYFLAQNNRKLRMKKSTLSILWILVAICHLGVIFILYDKEISVFYSAIYSALSRPLWALGIAWIVIACSTNNGGALNTFLSLKVWIPLSRLTYCTYLVNPLILNAIYLNTDTPNHFDTLPNSIMTLGFCMVIYACSYVLSMMFEMPYISLLKVLHPPQRKIDISSAKKE